MARPTSGASASCSSYLLGFPPVDCRPPYGWAAWWSSARDVEGRRGRFFGLKLYSRLAKGRCGETRRLVLRRVKFCRESTPARVESVVHRMIFHSRSAPRAPSWRDCQWDALPFSTKDTKERVNSCSRALSHGFEDILMDSYKKSSCFLSS